MMYAITIPIDDDNSVSGVHAHLEENCIVGQYRYITGLVLDQDNVHDFGTTEMVVLVEDEDAWNLILRYKAYECSERVRSNNWKDIMNYPECDV